MADADTLAGRKVGGRTQSRLWRSIDLVGRRIVPVIDVRVRLGLGRRDGDEKGMGVTVEHQNGLHTLLVDRVGDVIGLYKGSYESNPPTLSANWREFANGVCRLEKTLMVVLDVDRLLDLRKN